MAICAVSPAVTGTPIGEPTNEGGDRPKIAAAADLQSKQKEVAELTALLAERDGKLQEAQNEQAAFLRKQRELDDAKRELDLTIERR